MKKIIALIVMAILSLNLLNAKDIEEQISKEQLPEISQTFISKHFSTTPVMRVIKETEGRKVEYEVILEDGTELKFDRAGEWEEVDAKTAAVPSAIIPKEIQSAVASKYPKAFVVQVDRKKSGWEVELNDGTEIEFNSGFKITDIDR